MSILTVLKMPVIEVLNSHLQRMSVSVVASLRNQSRHKNPSKPTG